MDKVEKWLESSPFPVISRIITNADDAKMIALSAIAYNKGTLIVIPVATLEELIDSIRNSESNRNKQLDAS